jgi:hypothetical protein
MIPSMSIDVIVSPRVYVRSRVLTVRDSPKPWVMFRDIALPRTKPHPFRVLSEGLLKPCSSVKLKASGLAPFAAVDHA